MENVESSDSRKSVKGICTRFYRIGHIVLLVFFVTLTSYGVKGSLALAMDAEAVQSSIESADSDLSDASIGVLGRAEYQLGPEDVLSIDVWKDEILSRAVSVRPDGRITFPLIGEIIAEGRNVNDLTKEINERLSKFVSDPRVTVAVSKVNSYKIYVIGKVNQAGEFLLGQNADVMQALSLAGGLTPFARESSIRILRRVEGQQKVHEFDYSEVLEGKNLSQNIILRRGDVVMVP